MRLRTRLIVASLLAIELIALSGYMAIASPAMLPGLALALLAQYAIAVIVGLVVDGPSL